MLRPGSSELPTVVLTPSENPHAQISLESGAPLGEKSPFSQIGPPSPAPRGTTHQAQAIFARAVLEVYI